MFVNILSYFVFNFNFIFVNKKLKQNLTFISAVPHTHLTGVEIWTKIIRKGVDIGYLHRNKYYDFNFQNGYTIEPSINLTTVCVRAFKFSKIKPTTIF
jgi:hypothetical protein